MSDLTLEKGPGVRSDTKQNFENIGEYVVAVYEEQWFLAEIVMDQSGVGQGYTRLKYMTIKGSNAFAWAHDDVHTTLNEDILMEPVLPEPVNSRGNLGLKKKDLEKVLSLMVVVYFLLLKNFTCLPMGQKYQIGRGGEGALRAARTI